MRIASARSRCGIRLIAEQREMVPEVLDVGQVQLDRRLVALARGVDDFHERQLLVVLPHAVQALVLVAHAGGDQAVEEAVLAVELHLPAGADIRAAVGQDVGLGALHLHRLVVAADLEGQHAGRVDDLLRHVGVDPTEHLLAGGLPVLDGDALRERGGESLHFVQSLQWRVHAVGPPFLVSLTRPDHLEEAVQLGLDLGPAGEGGVDHVDVERKRRHVALTHEFVAHHWAQARSLLAAPVVVEDGPVRLELAGLLNDLPGPVGRRRVLAVAGRDLSPVGQVANRVVRIEHPVRLPAPALQHLGHRDRAVLLCMKPIRPGSRTG